MNRSIRNNQHMFMHVKQRLDYYHLPVNFPIDSTQLLARLLNLLDTHTNDALNNKENQVYRHMGKQNQIYASEDTSKISSSAFSSYVDEALRLQLSKHVRQNNQLHNQIIILKQQLTTHKHMTSKRLIADKTMNQTFQLEERYLQQNTISREQWLADQLQQVKYNYNMLMHMLHDDSNTDKEYIKKLIKHKRLPMDDGENINGEQTQGNYKSSSPTKQFTNTKRPSSNSKQLTHNYQLQLLQKKLQNRQQQITRLQTKLQFDGMNMNRIIKDFQAKKQAQNLSKIQERVQLLEKENHQVKMENEKMKKNAGDKQALRDHAEKLKAEVQRLKQSLGKALRKNKEMEYDQKRQQSRQKRKVNQSKNKLNGTNQKISTNKQKLKSHLNIGTHQKQPQLKLDHRESQPLDSYQLQSQLQSVIKQLDHQRMMRAYQTKQHQQKQHQTQLQLNAHKQKLKQIQFQLDDKILQESAGIRNKDSRGQNLQKDGAGKGGQIKEDSTNYLESTGPGSQQVVQFYRQEMNELKNRLESTEQERNKLKSMLIKTNHINQTLSNKASQPNVPVQHSPSVTQLITDLKRQRQLLRKSLQAQKQLNLQLQCQLNQNQEFETQFIQLKEKYLIMQKSQKNQRNGLQLRIAQLEQNFLRKGQKIAQKETTIKKLEAQLVACSERLRQNNRQLSLVEDELHIVKLEKGRLQRKFSQLYAENSISNSNSASLSLVKQTKLLVEIQTLTRQLQKHQILLGEQERTIEQLTELRKRTQIERHQAKQQNYSLLKQIDNFKKRENLYQMEFNELKEMNRHEQ